jgi:hypothetical protein
MASVDTAATVERRATSEPPKSGAIKVDLRKVERKPAPKTRRYWIGVMPDAPFDQTSSGGVAFMRYSERTPINEAGKLDERIPHAKGMVSELTDDQVEVIRRRVGNVVLRVIRGGGEEAEGKNSGKGARIVRLYLDDPRGYRPVAGDSPLGYWLYMVPISERMPMDWRSATPERMCDDRELTA